MILTNKRSRLTADFFEDLLLLHMNDWSVLQTSEKGPRTMEQPQLRNLE